MKNIYKAFLYSLIISTVIIFFQTKSIENFINFFTMPLSSKYFLGFFFDKFSLLLISCTASFIALSTNNYNLGSQGQIYIGGFISALILSNTPQDKFLIPIFFAITFLSVFIIGSLICFVSSYLKQKKGINELLTTYIISIFIIFILDFLISNPLKDETTNLLAMKSINKNYQIPHIKNFATLNISIFISIIIAIFCFLFFNKTLLGKKVLLTGKAYEFSKFRGNNVKAYNYFTMMISGGLNSVCGFFAVIGTYYTCFQGFYGNIGWNALTASLICCLNAKLIIPSCLILSYFFTTTDCAMITNSISIGTSEIIQAVLLFATAIPYFKGNKK